MSKMTKYSKFVSFLLVALLVISVFPGISSAKALVDLDARLKVLGKLEVLRLVEVGGNCKAIYAKVKVGNLSKTLGEAINSLHIEVPYEVYWYPQVGKSINGKLVADGKVKVTGENETITVKYVPAKNPNGPAGEYAIKLVLKINGKKVGKLVVAKVKINGDCGKKPGSDNPGGDNPGGDNPGGDNPGGDNPGGDNPGGDNPGGDNPGGDNPGGNNPGGDNPGSNNPGNNNPGGKLPKTATSYPTGAVVGAVVAILGVGLFALSRRKAKKS